MFNREFTKYKKKQNIVQQLIKYNDPINENLHLEEKDQLMFRIR